MNWIYANNVNWRLLAILSMVWIFLWPDCGGWPRFVSQPTFELASTFLNTLLSYLVVASRFRSFCDGWPEVEERLREKQISPRGKFSRSSQPQQFLRRKGKIRRNGQPPKVNLNIKCSGWWFSELAFLIVDHFFLYSKQPHHQLSLFSRLDLVMSCLSIQLVFIYIRKNGWRRWTYKYDCYFLEFTFS